MTPPLFPVFREYIAKSAFSSTELPPELQLWRGASRGHSVYFAPLEHTNPAPRLALVGITPGIGQALLALRAVSAGLRRGLPDEECLVEAKLQASFGGDMRRPLIEMLDTLGICGELGEHSCANLWTRAGYHKALFTSLLPYPTLTAGKNYSGSPRASNCEAFRVMLGLTVERLNSLPADAMVLPLGAEVSQALGVLRAKAGLKCRLPRIDGRDIYLPHPSGENGESVSLLGQWKPGTAEDYARDCHARYLSEEPWRKKDRSGPQDATKYLAARRARWTACRDLRRYFHLGV